MASLKKLLEKKAYVRIPLEMTETNHFALEVKVNGISGRFILDTGASNTCIGFENIERFKLTSEASEIKAAGAGATNMDTLIATKNRIQIGTWQQKRCKIVLFDLVHVNEALTTHNATPVDGIIGADVLENAKAVIDYGKRKLYLKK